MAPQPQMCRYILAMLVAAGLLARGEKMVADQDDDSDVRSSKNIFNFASHSAGAVVLDKSPSSAKGYSHLLNDDKDKYGLSQCDEKKWVVIGLSEDILVTSVALANYEKYSSMLKEFQLLASTSYPTEQWINLGIYEAQARLGEQTFNVTDSSVHTRYLKIKFNTHHGTEDLCTLSQIKVHGTTVIASFKQEVERSDQHMRDLISHLNDEGVMTNDDNIDFPDSIIDINATSIQREVAEINADSSSGNVSLGIDGIETVGLTHEISEKSQSSSQTATGSTTDIHQGDDILIGTSIGKSPPSIGDSINASELNVMAVSISDLDNAGNVLLPGHIPPLPLIDMRISTSEPKVASEDSEPVGESTLGISKVQNVLSTAHDTIKESSIPAPIEKGLPDELCSAILEADKIAASMITDTVERSPLNKTDLKGENVTNVEENREVNLEQSTNNVKVKSIADSASSSYREDVKSGIRNISSTIVDSSLIDDGNIPISTSTSTSTTSTIGKHKGEIISNIDNISPVSAEYVITNSEKITAIPSTTVSGHPSIGLPEIQKLTKNLEENEIVRTVETSKILLIEEDDRQNLKTDSKKDLIGCCSDSNKEMSVPTTNTSKTIVSEIVVAGDLDLQSPNKNQNNSKDTEAADLKTDLRPTDHLGPTIVETKKVMGGENILNSERTIRGGVLVDTTRDLVRDSALEETKSVRATLTEEDDVSSALPLPSTFPVCASTSSSLSPSVSVSTTSKTKQNTTEDISIESKSTANGASTSSSPSSSSSSITAALDASAGAVLESQPRTTSDVNSNAEETLQSGGPTMGSGNEMGIKTEPFILPAADVNTPLLSTSAPISTSTSTSISTLPIETTLLPLSAASPSVSALSTLHSSTATTAASTSTSAVAAEISISVPAPHGLVRLVNGPTVGFSPLCLETLRFSEFQASMAKKLKQKADSDKSQVPQNSQDNVFRQLMLKIKTLEMNYAIIEMYSAQVSECYRSALHEIYANMSQSQIASANNMNANVDQMSKTDLTLNAVRRGLNDDNDDATFTTQQQSDDNEDDDDDDEDDNSDIILDGTLKVKIKGMGSHASLTPVEVADGNLDRINSRNSTDRSSSANVIGVFSSVSGSIFGPTLGSQNAPIISACVGKKCAPPVSVCLDGLMSVFPLDLVKNEVQNEAENEVEIDAENEVDDSEVSVVSSSNVNNVYNVDDSILDSNNSNSSSNRKNDKNENSENMESPPTSDSRSRSRSRSEVIPEGQGEEEIIPSSPSPLFIEGLTESEIVLMISTAIAVALVSLFLSVGLCLLLCIRMVREGKNEKKLSLK